MRYRLLSVARSELAEAAKYYETQSRGLGFEFMDEFDAVVERIMRLPEGWKRVGNDIAAACFGASHTRYFTRHEAQRSPSRESFP